MSKVRILIVDDAVVMRRMISEVLGRQPDFEIIGTAANGKIALQKVRQLNPDLVTLDVEMPEMDGVAAVREIRKLNPKLPVLMFSTLTQRGAKVTLDALTAGATDYVTKPANVGNLTEGINRLQEELVPKIRAHCRHLLAKSQTDSESVTAILTRASLSKAFPPPRVRVSPIQIVAIGTSTGGPNALSDLVHQLPPDLGVPIVMVQHMPPIFTKMLAERLSTLGPRRCFEAEQGQLILPDAIYLAPGGKHLEVRRDRGNVIAHLHEGPAENSCRPAVDVLFRSVVAVYGSAVLGVILTGMGQDGLLGCRRIREQNGVIVVQDQATSVVWGMPGYVAQAGLADRVLPLPQIAGEIDRVLRENRLLQPRARAA